MFVLCVMWGWVCGVVVCGVVSVYVCSDVCVCVVIVCGCVSILPWSGAAYVVRVRPAAQCVPVCLASGVGGVAGAGCLLGSCGPPVCVCACALRWAAWSAMRLGVRFGLLWPLPMWAGLARGLHEAACWALRCWRLLTHGLVPHRPSCALPP